MQLFTVFLIQVYLIFAAQALTDEQKVKVLYNGEKCMEETNTDYMVLSQLTQCNLSNDSKIKAFTYCFLKASEFIDDGGSPRDDVIKEKLGKDITQDSISKILNICKPTTASTPTDRAVEFYECYCANTHLIKRY